MKKRFKTTYQLAAYRRPFDPNAMPEPGAFTHSRRVGDDTVASVVVTCERDPSLYGGRPYWHASVAYHRRGDRAPADTGKIFRQKPDEILSLLRAELDGVGQDPEHVLLGGKAVHLYRAMTDEEIAGLPAGWLEQGEVPEEFDAEQFERDRYEAFRSLDLGKFRAYCRKYQVPMFEDDRVMLAGMHKGRLLDALGLTEEEKEVSRRWLLENGFFPTGPGQFNRG